MKLSPLQKMILKLAAQHKAKNLPTMADINVAALKIHYYKFTPLQGGLHFDRQQDGIYQHRAASVAIAKSFARLADRGLVDRVPGWGVRLTPEGERWAANIVRFDPSQKATR